MIITVYWRDGKKECYKANSIKEVLHNLNLEISDIQQIDKYVKSDRKDSSLKWHNTLKQWIKIVKKIKL